MITLRYHDTISVPLRHSALREIGWEWKFQYLPKKYRYTDKYDMTTGRLTSIPTYFYHGWDKSVLKVSDHFNEYKEYIEKLYRVFDAHEIRTYTLYYTD